ncbi:hypothetical protein [Neptunomonas antarctica]|nr:hypothetical protein [Neptunomonas antarctica]
MPWRYFQLNARYFNKSKGIYSKQDINDMIPEQWRLQQWIDTCDIQPHAYPVFVKPEWGQNSKGIERADNHHQLDDIRRRRSTAAMQHLIQEAAQGKFEFEIFVIPSDTARGDCAVLSVTKVVNNGAEEFPINGIYNKHTHYIDVTPQLSSDDLDAIWGYFKTVGDFRISRFGIRADSLESFIAGHFKVIEINLFVPMPLVLLTQNTALLRKIKLAIHCTWMLAKITKTIPNDQDKPFILFKKIGFIQRAKRLD